MCSGKNSTNSASFRFCFTKWTLLPVKFSSMGAVATWSLNISKYIVNIQIYYLSCNSSKKFKKPKTFVGQRWSVMSEVVLEQLSKFHQLEIQNQFRRTHIHLVFHQKPRHESNAKYFASNLHLLIKISAHTSRTFKEAKYSYVGCRVHFLHRNWMYTMLLGYVRN